MKVLLIGPYPPPHGGISVHVLTIHRRLVAEGVSTSIMDPRHSRNKFVFLRAVRRHASEGWTIHLHTNGHNYKSWLLTLLCGRVAKTSESAPRILTLHSGMAPRYLTRGGIGRLLAKQACRFYDRIICVNSAVQKAVVSLGFPVDRTEIAPAVSETHFRKAALDSSLVAWIARRRPLFSTTLFFRPEYGFDMLVDAMSRIRQTHPMVGCAVMGGGEDPEQAIRRIRAAGLEDHILLVGDIDHDLCMTVIARSDIFLRPTLEDGDSISVREALSLGVPVVASRVGTRPGRVLLFEVGDLAGMLSQIETALTSQPHIPEASAGSVDGLIGVYGCRTASGGACG
jgi:glycogen synthase